MEKRKTAKRKPHKTIQGLKEAIAHAASGGPKPMMFEHVPVEKTEYDLISDRVMAAVTEINGALQAAHECAQMRVFLAARQRTTDHAMRFQPQIYRLTHSTITLTVDVNEPKMQWREVKDPTFEDAAGVGLAALQKKREPDQGLRED